MIAGARDKSGSVLSCCRDGVGRACCCCVRPSIGQSGRLRLRSGGRTGCHYQADVLFSIVFLLSAASFIVVAVMTVTAPLLPLIAHDFGCSVGAAGIVVSAFVVPYGACQIVFGPLGDRAGKLRVIALALATSTLFVFGAGAVSSLHGLALMRFLAGVAMAGTVPLAMAYIADEVPYAERQLVIGRYVNGLVLGQIAGGCLGGLAAQYFAWRQIFYCFSAVCAVVAYALWRAAARQPTRAPTPRRDLREILAIYLHVLRVPATRAVIIAGTLEGFFIFGISAYFGAFLRQRFNLGYATIGLMLSMYGVGGMLFGATIKHIVPRLRERGMVLAGTSVLGLCYVLLPWAPVWWLCPPLFLLAGFGFYTFHNTMQTQATELSSSARGTAVALWVFMLFTGQGLGVTVVGQLVDRAGYTLAFSLASVGITAVGAWFYRQLGQLGQRAVQRQ